MATLGMAAGPPLPGPRTSGTLLLSSAICAWLPEASSNTRFQVDGCLSCRWSLWRAAPPIVPRSGLSRVSRLRADVLGYQSVGGAISMGPCRIAGGCRQCRFFTGFVGGPSGVESEATKQICLDSKTGSQTKRVPKQEHLFTDGRFKRHPCTQSSGHSNDQPL